MVFHTLTGTSLWHSIDASIDTLRYNIDTKVKHTHIYRVQTYTHYTHVNMCVQMLSEESQLKSNPMGGLPHTEYDVVDTGCHIFGMTTRVFL